MSAANSVPKDLPRMDGFEQMLVMTPAFDKRHPNPGKNYGIHGVELRFFLTGPVGAVTFTVFTNWQLPHVTEETMQRTLDRHPDRIGLKCSFLPSAAGIGYHWPTARYEGQTESACDLLRGGKCYSDSSFVRSEEVLERLIREGSEGVWRYMRDFYDEVTTRE